MCLSSREREQQQRRAAAKGGRHKCSSPWLFFFRKHVADVAGLFPRAATPRAVGPPGGWPTWRPRGADAVRLPAVGSLNHSLRTNYAFYRAFLAQKRLQRASVNDALS